MAVLSHSASGDPYSRYSIEAGENDIATIVKILAERQKIIWIFVAVSVLLSILYVVTLRPQYTATAKVMLTSPDIQKQSNIVQNLLQTGLLNGADLLSQIQIMQSPAVIERFIVDQGLYQDPEFGGSTTYEDFYMLSDDRKQALVNRVTKRLSLIPVTGTSIVTVSFKSADPVKAATLANAHIETYAKVEESKMRDQSQSALSWLADRLNILKQEVYEAESAVEKARDQDEIGLTKNEDSRLEKIDILNRRLSDVQAELAETVAVLETAKKLKNNPKQLDSMPDFIGDRLMENLKETEANLLRKKAILEQTYGPKHPEIVALHAEMEAFQNKMTYELERYIEAQKKKQAILEGQISLMQQQVTDYRHSYHGDSEQRIKIRNLQTQADTARALLNSFTKTYMESLQNLNIDKSSIRIVARASVPHASDMPEKALIIILSALTGLFLGILVVLVTERIQNVIQAPQQLERLLGYPVYGLLPRVKIGKSDIAANYILEHAASPLAEAIRTLFTTLQLRDPNTKPGGRVITITSTFTDEGKTTNAVWLATTAAQSGKKVLIIDTDMRRPSLHKAYGIGNGKGLTDYLSDRLPLDDIIYKSHASGVHIITSKAVPTHALVLLASDRMEALIRRLRESYDMIIMDAPTSQIFSDARILAKLSDKTFYMVEWNKTDRDSLKQSVKPFSDLGYNDIALILNKVDEKRLANFGGSEAAYMAYLNSVKK